jgi:hypothetical protein
MFDDIERLDADAWAGYLAPDAVMRLGNRDPVYGREACRDALAALYRRVATQVSVPAVTIFRTNGRDQIADYRVYINPSPIYTHGIAQTD